MSGGGRLEVGPLAVDCSRTRRLSSFGINFKGVWKTEGAADGGLKMMWSCCGELLSNSIEGAGLRFNFFFVRGKDD